MPTGERYFEDYRPGAVYEFGDVTMEEARIIEFAREFDPQPIHVDPEAAARGIYGGIIASGFHTTAVMMRLLADNYLSRVASLGSPGIDELRWLLPVRPGDTLRLRLTILDARRSASKPDRGVVRTRAEVLNQNGRTALHLIATNFLRTRTPT
ncbi:MAG TPA: MaoC family dehydratase [Mycobacteriales bacterium]|nr:MaoC family dehydratase [Mycobacteriales bacterium]